MTDIDIRLTQIRVVFYSKLECGQVDICRIGHEENRFQGGEFIQCVECGLVEACLVENLGRGAGEHCHQTYVDDLGGLLAYDMHPQQLHIVAAEQEFQESGCVADDPAASMSWYDARPTM